jgi:hypothetical protein
LKECERRLEKGDPLGQLRGALNLKKAGTILIIPAFFDFIQQ